MKIGMFHTAAALVAISSAALAGGSVKGKITLKGAAPTAVSHDAEVGKHQDAKTCTAVKHQDMSLIVDKASKGIKNVFISIRKVKGGKKLEVPSTPILSDQKSCVFTPHIMVVPKGGSVELKNSDDVLHNTHSWSKKNSPFNEGIPAGKSTTKKFDKREKIKLTCDVHPWMTGYIIVTDTPYWALTGTDGTFEIKDLPAGTYKAYIWHETQRKDIKKEITIEEGKAADLSLELSVEG